MILLDNLGNYRKGRIWLNSFPPIQYEAIETMNGTISKVANDTWEKKSVCLELSLLPRHVSNFALLGMEYVPKSSNYIKLQVFVSEDNDTMFDDSLANLTDKVHIGIPKQYADAVFQTAYESLQSSLFPAGQLSICIGAHGEIGSSRNIFTQITRIIFKIILFDVKMLKKEDIERIITEEIDKTFSK